LLKVLINGRVGKFSQTLHDKDRAMSETHNFGKIKRLPLVDPRKDYQVTTTRGKWLTSMMILHEPTGLYEIWKEDETLPVRLSYAQAYDRIMPKLKKRVLEETEHHRNKKFVKLTARIGGLHG